MSYYEIERYMKMMEPLRMAITTDEAKRLLNGDWNVNYEEDSVDREVQKRLRDAQVEAEVQKRLRIIESYGTDDFVTGNVIRFDKYHKLADGSEKLYVYAAIKAGDKWYLSGPMNGGKKFSWGDLCAFMASGDKPVTRFEAMMAGFPRGETVSPQYMTPPEHHQI